MTSLPSSSSSDDGTTTPALQHPREASFQLAPPSRAFSFTSTPQDCYSFDNSINEALFAGGNDGEVNGNNAANERGIITALVVDASASDTSAQVLLREVVAELHERQRRDSGLFSAAAAIVVEEGR